MATPFFICVADANNVGIADNSYAVCAIHDRRNTAVNSCSQSRSSKKTSIRVFLGPDSEQFIIMDELTRSALHEWRTKSA